MFCEIADKFGFMALWAAMTGLGLLRYERAISQHSTALQSAAL